jgi:ABC-type Fe3+-siderophore transport system permease subunit
MHHEPEGDVDILEYAMHSNTLVALRAILLAWSVTLNQKISDSIGQKALYANRLFNHSALLELAAHFPVEYNEFVTSIRLVPAHSSVGSLDGGITRTIPHGKRLIVVGSGSFPLDANFQPKKSPPIPNVHKIFQPFVYCYLLLVRNIFWVYRWLKVKVIDGEEINKQAVTPFMLPIRYFSQAKHLYCAIRTCDALQRVDLFDSDVLIAAIIHNWNTRGWRLYLSNLIEYALTIITFVISIYTYQNVTSEQNKDEKALMKARGAMVGFMFFLSLFGLHELCQVIGKFLKLHNCNRANMSIARTFHILINHFVCDVWNIIDYSVVITGFYGMYGIFSELSECRDYTHPVNVNNGAAETLYYCKIPKHRQAVISCLLAATAVLLWFKVLYFLRPFKAAGQFGKFAVLCVVESHIHGATDLFLFLIS